MQRKIFQRLTLPVVCSILCLMLGLTAFVFRLLTLSEPQLAAVFKGDELFVADVTGSLLRGDSTLTGWYLPPAPFFYPDWLIVGAAMQLTGQPLLSCVAFAVVNTLIALAAACGCVQLTRHPSRQQIIAAMVAATGLLFVAVSYGIDHDILYSMRPAFHAGTFAMTLVGLWLFLWLERHGIRSFVGGIALLAFASNALLLGLSDLLTVLYLAAPLTAAVVAGHLIQRRCHRRAAWLLMLTWSFTLIGSGATDLLGTRQPPSVQGQMSVENILAGLTIFARQTATALLHGAPMEWLLVVLTVAGVGHSLSLRQRGDGPPMTGARDGDAAESIFGSFAYLSAWGVIGGLVVGCQHYIRNAYEFFSHYWLPVMMLPALVLPYYAADFMRRLPSRIAMGTGPMATAAALAVCCFAAIDFARRPQVVPLWAYRPEAITRLEEVCREKGLNVGLADYYTSRECSAYSRQTQVVAVDRQQFGFFHWMCDDGLYKQVKDAAATEQVDYVLANSVMLPVEEITDRFGPPDEILPIGSLTPKQTVDVLVYRRGRGPEQLQASLTRQRFLADRPGDVVPIAASTMQQAIGRRDGDALVADAAVDPAGVLLYGPYCRLRPGHYRITADVLTKGLSLADGAWYDIGYMDEAAMEFRQFVWGNFCDDHRHILLEFDVAEDLPADNQYQFRIYFPGKGTMRISNIVFTNLSAH